MLTYEQQTKKLLSKRQAVLDRIESDKAEIEKINAKLNAIQLAKIRDALGCDEQGLFELMTKHPEQLAKLVYRYKAAFGDDVKRQLGTEVVVYVSDCVHNRFVFVVGAVGVARILAHKHLIHIYNKLNGGNVL